jgi:hypothetical protein
MKQILSLLMLVVLMAVLWGCTRESSAEDPLPESQYVELNRGEYTLNGISTKKQTKIISSQIDYAAELANYTSTTPTSVDFTKGKVLLIDMGGRNTGGYSIGVTSVNVADNWVVTNIRLVKPGQGCIVTQALTNPYQFVFIPSLKEILVSESMEIINC